MEVELRGSGGGKGVALQGVAVGGGGDRRWRGGGVGSWSRCVGDSRVGACLGVAV